VPNPTAPQGSLCVYESVAANRIFDGFLDPVTTTSTTTTEPFGVIVRMFANNAGDTYIY
jgi:hypothetical protein